ncbi:MAG: hypothetical protein WKG07_25830 [Hymenobacter sp.]
MKSRFLLPLAGCLVALSAPQLGHAQAAASNKNVIMYIGDGFGLAPKTAARMAMGQGRDGKRFNTDPGFQVLALDKLKYNATVDHALAQLLDYGLGPRRGGVRLRQARQAGQRGALAGTPPPARPSKPFWRRPRSRATPWAW